MKKRKIISTHETCPVCGHNECFSRYDDGNGYCHSECGGFVRLVEEEKPDIGSLIPIDSDYRGIPCDLYTRLGGTLVAQDGGSEPYAMLYQWPHAVQKRILPKDFSDNKGFTNDHLFGMDQYNAGSSKYITIVEGADDRFAAIAMLGETWHVVALPNGLVTKSLLKNCKSWLDAYENIIIATDNDGPGDKAAEALNLVFPNKCYRVSLTKYKDAMEYWENDAADEFKYAWINRKKYVPAFDTNTPEQFIRMLADATEAKYIPTGITEYDELGLGLFQSHLTVFTAQEGIGKTELMRMLEYNLIKNHPDIPFAYCHLEETPQRSLLGLVSYELDKNVTRKDLITDIDEVNEAIERMMGRENVHQFRIGTDEDPDVLIDRIKYYANVCDCKYVFFEPIQDIAAQRQTQESLVQYLDKLAINLSRVAAETGCGIVTIAHMNDDGQIRDSRQIGKQASVRIDLERDMHAPTEDERNRTRLFIRKNRPVGPLGYAGELTFDLESFTLKESVYAGD